jgi:photosystem II stability/assembly factor-like uncharacterized protein
MAGHIDRRRFLVGASCGIANRGWGNLDPRRQPASFTPRAHLAVLHRITRAGRRLVAVGERGIVVWSDDGGKRWRQASVPVDATLTSVTFSGEGLGWACGHGGVLLHTKDGGETWTLQFEGPADRPFLAMNFTSAHRGVAVGAYGMAVATVDAGQSWQPFSGQLKNPRGMHLYAVVNAGTSWVVAGEQGFLAHSVDDGQSFANVQVPSRASFFALAPLDARNVLAAGLLGTAFRMDLARGALTPVVLSGRPTILSATTSRNGVVVLAGSPGRLLLGDSEGSRFASHALPDSMPLTSLAETDDGGLVGVGPMGARRLAASPELVQALK